MQTYNNFSASCSNIDTFLHKFTDVQYMFLLNKSPMSTNEKFITAIRYFCESLCNRREHSGKHNLHASLLV